MTARKIAHIDMDAFFASCELTQYPQLRGLPMVVGGGSRHAPRPGPDGELVFSTLRDYAGRGVLTTATYEARAFGLHSGMPTAKAARLAPDAILLPVSFDLYRHYSRRFKDAVRTVTDVIQDVGIDEIYADLTDLPDDPLTLAQRIKTAVKLATGGLTCSVGITPNKLLSKLASDMNKPDGITLLQMEDIPTRIWPLAAGKVNGIGPKASEKLAQLNIHTIGELAAADIALLQEHFGLSYAAWLHDAAHGRDDRPLVTEREPKGMSRETTFENDLHPKRHREQLGAAFTALCQRVAEDLKRKGFVGRNVAIKLRFDNFETVTRAITLQAATADAGTIRLAAGQCLKRVPLERSIRLLGVRVGALEAAPAEDEPQQGSLF